MWCAKQFHDLKDSAIKFKDIQAPAVCKYFQGFENNAKN